jgi:NAD-dependent dihydropyrimidine dehydrogenase PreA subunit
MVKYNVKGNPEVAPAQRLWDLLSTNVQKRGIKVIDQAKCTKCGSCILICPPEYDAIVKLSPPGLVPQAK